MIISAATAKEELDKAKKEYLVGMEDTINLAIKGAIQVFSKVARLNFQKEPIAELKEAILKKIQDAGYECKYERDTPRQGDGGDTKYYIRIYLT